MRAIDPVHPVNDFSRKSEQASKLTFVLFCTPSLGVLDSWISVVDELKQNAPEADFVLVGCPIEVVSELRESSLWPIAQRIFTGIAFQSESGHWYAFKDIASGIDCAAKLSVGRKIQGMVPKRLAQGFLPPGLRKKLQKLLLVPISGALELVRKPRQRSSALEFPSSLFGLDSRNSVLLFDLHQVKGNHEFISRFDGLPKFSLLHGIEVLGIGRSKVVPLQESLDREKIVAFAYSERDVGFYRDRHGLEASAIRVIGVPRHERQHCLAPSSLVLAYALAVATSGRAAQILMAGFDGYGRGDSRNDEVEAMPATFGTCSPDMEIFSVTPTRYKGLSARSIYGL